MTESRPALLVSLHDISPQTYSACRDMLQLVTDLGYPQSALTALVIPNHQGQAELKNHIPTLELLRALDSAGASLAMHGYTHRMIRTPRRFVDWPAAYLFARGQGEFIAAKPGELLTRLALGRKSLSEAGLDDATHAFIPPAWLLSRAAREELCSANCSFYELLSGIVCQGKLYARRLIGWGSLNLAESVATSIYAALISELAPTDTRLAIHPQDMARRTSRASIERVLKRLAPHVVPLNYYDYLAQRVPGFCNPTLTRHRDESKYELMHGEPK